MPRGKEPPRQGERSASPTRKTFRPLPRHTYTVCEVLSNGMSLYVMELLIRLRHKDSAGDRSVTPVTRCSKGAAQGPRADDFVRLWVGEKRGLEGLPRRRLFSSKTAP